MAVLTSYKTDFGSEKLQNTKDTVLWMIKDRSPKHITIVDTGTSQWRVQYREYPTFNNGQSIPKGAECLCITEEQMAPTDINRGFHQTHPTLSRTFSRTGHEVRINTRNWEG